MARQAVCRVLNVAEKNDAAKRISAILSAGQMLRREGFSKYNKIYEFDYTLLGRNCRMIMTSLSGHLLNFDFVGSYRKWHSCHPLSLFDVEIEKYVTENMLNIQKTLEREVRTCDALVVWTDCDREGENIGYEIIDICQNVKPHIEIRRARFSEITERSIHLACRNLVAPDKKVSDAVDVRQELDLRIGAAFTRFQTLRLQKVFPDVLKDKLISYGSCQFPTLGFVVERHKAREQFQSEQFWKIEVSHVTLQEDSQTPLTANFAWKRYRLFSELACSVLHANCIEPPTVATVVGVTCKPKSRWRPVALDTVELEKLSSRKLRINAKETMRIAEKLYTQGFISYPRTETNIFPKDIDLAKLIEDQTQHPAWGGFARRLLETGGPTPRNGSKTDKAHPPIHPTKFTSNLSGDEARVYELVTRHFLACCHRDAQGQETNVEIDLGGEKFTAQGLMIVAKNYLEVYIYDKWNAKVIPVYTVGDEFEPTTVSMTSGRTTAPPLLTEADLISLMDKHGIGTDATHAEHIETIKQRLYVRLTNDQRFMPAELGLGLVEGYNMMGYEMSRPELRAELEADLTRICNGEADRDAVCRHHVAKYRAVFQEAIRNAVKLDEALAVYLGAQTQVSENALNPTEVSTPVRRCPLCGKDMVLKRKKDGGFMLSCMGYPNCRNAVFLPKSVLDIKVDESVCGTCRPAPVHRVKVKLDRTKVPAYFDPEQVICIGGCDLDVNNILSIRYNGSSSSSYGPPSSFSSSGSSWNARSDGRAASSSAGVGGSGGGPGFLSRGSSRRNAGGRGGKRKMSSSSSSATSRARRQDQPVFEGLGDAALQDDPTCNCGEPGVRLTVRKEGPNKGRDFFKCPRRDGACRFFVWADAPPSDSGGSRGTKALRQRQNTAPPPTRAPSPTRKCQCDLAAAERAVRKEGPNQGRRFFACDKPRDQQCGFFEWAEGQPESQGQRKGTESKAQPSNWQASRQNSAPTRTRKAPTCSNCGTQGHTKRGCPNK